MTKKILTALLIAVAVFLAYQLNSGDFLEKLSVAREEKTPADCPVLIGDKVVKLGMDEKEVVAVFGKPKDTLLSEYGFCWNIYHENFKNYIQIGVKDGVVVAVFTNSSEFVFEEIRSGEEKNKVNQKFGEALDGIVKGSTRYLANGTENSNDLEIYKIRGGYVTFFYDACANNSLTSVNIIDCDVEQEFKMLYAPGTDSLKDSLETQNFYVTNAERVKAGLEPFERHRGLDEVALLHSLDMVKNNYFNHLSQNGDTVLKRAQKHNIKFRSIGENLAMGAQNSLYLHQLLMNSEGHRKNILGDFTHMGVGIAFDDQNTPYMTQNFLK